MQKESLEALKLRMNQPINSAIEATKLYTTNAQVDALNEYELSHLSGDEIVYEMNSGCKEGNEAILKQLMSNSSIIPQALKLK